MCSVEKGVLSNFATFTGKRLCQSLFFKRVSGTAVFLSILRNFSEHNIRGPILSAQLEFVALIFLMKDINKIGQDKKEKKRCTVEEGLKICLIYA